MAGTTTDRRQGITSSVAIKVPCKAATTTNITLSGEQTIDSIACVTDDRVLVKNQTDASENGIYYVNTSSWSRAPDWDGSLDVRQGTKIRVNSGTQKNFYVVSTDDPITIGTTEVSLVATDADSVLREDLADDASGKGDALVTGIRSDTDATSFTLHEYNENRPTNIKTDFSAVGDDSTNNATILNSVATAAKKSLVPSGTFRSTAATNLRRLEGDGVDSSIIKGVGVGFRLAYSATKLQDLKVISDTSPTLDIWTTDITDVVINGVHVECTAATSSTALNINKPTTRVGVFGSYVKGVSYGLLVNSGADGGGELLAVGNWIHAVNGDAIELNASGITWSYSAIVGNILTGGPSGSASTSGFSIGIAGGTEWTVISGIVSKTSRLESIHLENAGHGTVISGAALADTGQAAVHILNKSGATGPITNAVYGKHDSATTAHNGYNQVNDANGTVEDAVVVGNKMDGYERGFALGAPTAQVLTGNVAINCTYAYSATNGIFDGVNQSGDCATLWRTSGPSICGKVVSRTVPTAICTRTGTAAAGNIVKGFSFPVSMVHTGGGAETFDLFPTPTRMIGKLTCLVSFGANTAVISADVTWDGTTFTIVTSITRVAGVFSNVTLVENSGNIAFRVTSGTAVTTDIMTDFDGAYYLEG